MALFIKKNGSLQQVSVGHEISKSEQQKSVSLDLASGDQIVTPDNGQVLTQVLIKKPETLLPANIKSGVSIAGVVGSYEAVDYLEKRLAQNDTYSYSNGNITYLYAYSFYCDQMIESLSFSNCTGLGNAKHSGDGTGYTFLYCRSLTSIIMPKLKSISNGQNFYNLPLITNLSFPELTGTIPTSTFGFCSNLKTINLGNATGLYSKAFENCSLLTDITLTKTGSICTLNNTNVFNGVTGPVTIHVPSNLISSYQSASNWVTLYNDGKVTFVAIQ